MKLDPLRVLRRLDELAEQPADMLTDYELNAALDPFRGRMPIRVECGGKCRRKISWWGLPVAGAPGWSPPPRSRLRTSPFEKAPPTAEAPETGYVFGVSPWPVSGARVIYTTQGPRKENLWGERIPAESLRPQPPYPYSVWSVQRVIGPGVEPSDPSGHGQRLTFTCQNKKNPHRYPITNAKMLRFAVQAYAHGWETITLPDGLQPMY
jgi:hypothetical protein